MKMPKGKYWLGDPIYIIRSEDWASFCKDLWDSEGVFTFKKKTVCAFGTAYGDGTYTDQFGNQYPVDAGLIGLTPRSFHKQPFGCVAVEFPEDIEVSVDDGVIYIGHYVIDTKGSDEEEE